MLSISVCNCDAFASTQAAFAWHVQSDTPKMHNLPILWPIGNCNWGIEEKQRKNVHFSCVNDVWGHFLSNKKLKTRLMCRWHREQQQKTERTNGKYACTSVFYSIFVSSSSYFSLDKWNTHTLVNYESHVKLCAAHAHTYPIISFIYRWSTWAPF